MHSSILAVKFITKSVLKGTIFNKLIFAVKTSEHIENVGRYKIILILVFSTFGPKPLINFCGMEQDGY